MLQDASSAVAAWVALEERQVSPEQLEDVFERSYAESWIAWIMQQEPQLIPVRVEAQSRGPFDARR